MDINGNNLMDDGEGVQNLLVYLDVENQSVGEGWTMNGVAEIHLSPDLPMGTNVQVSAPYLHWGTVIKSPDAGGVETVTLALDAPSYPVYLLPF